MWCLLNYIIITIIVQRVVCIIYIDDMMSLAFNLTAKVKTWNKFVGEINLIAFVISRYIIICTLCTCESFLSVMQSINKKM